MPFELGLAVGPSGRRAHEWFVFEERRHRLFCVPHRPTTAELNAVYQDVRRAAKTVRHDLRTTSPFEARSFDELVVAGRISAERRIPSLRRWRCRGGGSTRVSSAW